MDKQRRSGILLHPTSLPGRYGIGSMNQAAYDWVDFLARSKQTLWQILPLGPTSYGDSPYQSFSTFAGNPYLISLEDLVQCDLLEQSVLDSAPNFPDSYIDFGGIYNWKLPVLRQAAERLKDSAETVADPGLLSEFHEFCHANAEWLDDYALFMALKDENNGAQVGDSIRNEHEVVEGPGDKRSYGHHENNRHAHAYGAVQAAAHSQEGAKAQEPGEHKVIDKNGADHNYKECIEIHFRPLLLSI